MMKTKRLLGRKVEFQYGASSYDINGHIIRPTGKIIKVLNKEKMIVAVKHLDGKITKEQIGERILFE